MIGALCACERVIVSMVEVSEVEVVPSSIILLEGRSDTASAVVRESGGAELSSLSVTWTVDDPEIATVTSDGIVVARSAGTTRVRASSEGVSGIAELTVLSSGNDDDDDDDDDEDEGGRGKGRRGRG